MTNSTELLVRFGAPESGALVPVEVAERGVRYTCPSCHEVLVLKDSAAKKRRKHFAHPSNGACSQESIFHATAKRLIAEAIRRHAVGDGEGIVLLLNCQSCLKPVSRTLPSGTFTDAKEEYCVEGFRCDVMGMDSDGPRLAIEVMYKHASTEAKMSGLTVRMIEVQAFDILENPTRWKPTRHTMKPSRCEPCKTLSANETSQFMSKPTTHREYRRRIAVAPSPAPRATSVPTTPPQQATLRNVRTPSSALIRNVLELERLMRTGSKPPRRKFRF